MNNIKDKFSIKTLGLSGVLAAGLLLANYGTAKAQDAPAPPPARPDAAQTDRVPPPNEGEKPRPRRRGKDEPRPPAPNGTAERPGEVAPPPDSRAGRPGEMPQPPRGDADRPNQMPPPNASGERPNRMPMQPDGGVERPGERPMPAINSAMEQGLRDGMLQAEQDRTGAKGFRPQKSRAYKKATNGFQGSNGDKQFYKDNYRQGFVRGYDRSFGGEMRSGMNAPPAPPAGNRPRPERDNARRPQPNAPRNAPPAPPVNN